MVTKGRSFYWHEKTGTSYQRKKSFLYHYVVNLYLRKQKAKEIYYERREQSREILNWDLFLQKIEGMLVKHSRQTFIQSR